MKLVSVAEMRAIEKDASEHGLSYAQMMRNAGIGLAEVVLDVLDWDESTVLFVLGLVGSGNNGGDTLVALMDLADRGCYVTAYLVAPRAEDDALLKQYQSHSYPLKEAWDDANFETLDDWIGQSSFILDGVLGTGLKLPVKPETAAVLEHVAQVEDLPLVVAVDCPSGVDCESGEVAPETIPADLTVCMAAVKDGLLKLPAYEMVGQLAVTQIGLQDDLVSWKAVQRSVVTAEEVQSWLPQRPLDAHKGSFGQALIAAGSINYTGAAWLSAAAAYRVGAGLVRLAVPAPLHTALAGQLPEATWLILPHEMGVISDMAADVLLKNIDKADVLLVGPGLGLEDTTADFINRLLKVESGHAGHGGIGFITASKTGTENNPQKKLPQLVIDADGLKLLARIEAWWKLLPDGSILTPHPGEMAVMTGLSLEEIQADRQAVASRFAVQWNCMVVLKGAFTVIAAPDGAVSVIPVATAALAKAGTGDVLAGMIAGLAAQGLPADQAAIAGAWLHAQAGLLAEAELESSAAVLASDVLDEIATVLGMLG